MVAARPRPKRNKSSKNKKLTPVPTGETNEKLPIIDTPSAQVNSKDEKDKPKIVEETPKNIPENKPDNPTNASGVILKPLHKGGRQIITKTYGMLESTDESDRVIQIKESDLKKMITEIISSTQNDLVRKSEVKSLVQSVIREMVISKNIQKKGEK